MHKTHLIMFSFVVNGGTNEKGPFLIAVNDVKGVIISMVCLAAMIAGCHKVLGACCDTGYH